MIINIILITIVLVSLGGITYIVFSKISKIRTLDVASVPEAQADRLRDRLLLDRLRRGTTEKSEPFKKIYFNFLNFIKKIISNIPRKIFELEKKYEQESQKKVVITDGTIKAQIDSLFNEAELKLNEEDYSEAEKKLIEIVSLDPKNLKSYRLLIEVYLSTKEFKQAKETADFVVKMLEKKYLKKEKNEHGEEVICYENPTEMALAYDDLADIHHSLGEDDLAGVFWSKALQSEPNSPKYLDKFIESCIILKQKSKAFDAIKKLEEVNPENQKIKDFYERIKYL